MEGEIVVVKPSEIEESLVEIGRIQKNGLTDYEDLQAKVKAILLKDEDFALIVVGSGEGYNILYRRAIADGGFETLDDDQIEFEDFLPLVNQVLVYEDDGDDDDDDDDGDYAHVPDAASTAQDTAQPTSATPKEVEKN